MGAFDSLGKQSDFGSLISDIKPKLFEHPKILIINLDRRLDRWEKVTRQLKNMNITNYERFSAVDGLALVWDIYLEKLFRPNRKLCPDWIKTHCYRAGAIGCALSHYKLWKKIIDTVENDDDYIVVLEDDPVFEKDYMERYKIIDNYLKKDMSWDLCYFNVLFDHENKNNKMITSEIRLMEKDKTYSSCGTNMYVLRKRTAKKLVQWTTEDRISRAIDSVLVDYFDRLKIYQVVKPLIWTNTVDVTSDCMKHDLVNRPKTWDTYQL